MKITGELKMKKINLKFLAAFLMLVPIYLSANDWNTPSYGYFKGQTEIDNMDPSENKAMATVSFGDQVFYFSNLQDAGKGKISLRKLTNTGANGTISWTQKKTTGMANLNDLGTYEWQPAPVVFNNVLYLFVGNKSNGISYSAYNAGADTWGPLVALPGDFSNTGSKKLGYGMAAVVVDDRLCLVAENYWTYMQFWTTTDLTTWTYYRDFGHSGVITSYGTADSDYGPISAISEIYTENGTRKSKLRYAYIDGNKHPRTVECSFDDSGKYHQISDAVISTKRTYQSIVLIEGTVTGDPGSAGHCVQAFLKLNKKENGYCRYRIQRWQSKEGGSWTNQENNLVKQNYLWARQLTNLCAVNFAIGDTVTKNIRQYMCLIYTTYDDWDWHLACAWAETDRLVYDPADELPLTLAGPENTQYIGYIEGPPPYYLNHLPLADPYRNPNAGDISELEFATSAASGSTKEIGFDVGGEVSLKAGCFKAGLSAAYGYVGGSEYKKTFTQAISVVGKEGEKGYYITLSPVINRAQYFVKDVHGTCIDTTWYFTMTDPEINIEPVELQQGLDPGNPSTYIKRPGINFASFNSLSFGKTSVPWAGNALSSAGISIEKSKTQTNKISAKLNLGAELGKMFDIGFDGSFDYSMETTTSTGNEITASTRLNEAINPNDVTHLNYNVYWINPIFNSNVNNWWLHDGAPKQNTWCVTYEVTSLDSKKVDGINDPASSGNIGDSVAIQANIVAGVGRTMDSFLPTKSSLSQNYPNPFKSNTVIKYQIGIEDPQAGSGNHGCQTKLAVYNLSGQEVAMLVNENRAPGSYEVTFNVSQLTPGIYFYSLEIGNFKDIKKLIVLK